MWSEHGWRPITAYKAAQLHPGGSVSSHGHLFMCELCGQYVSLAHGSVYTPYFRHSAGESDKTCPERTFGPGITIDYCETKHDLPIRIKLYPPAFPSDFSFEIGLLGVPSPVLKRLRDSTIKIGPVQEYAPPLSFQLKERLRENEISYVPIGSIPFAEYKIDLDCRDIPAFFYWPERLQGMDPAGTLFDVSSGKKLPYDADVQVGRDYYLLQSSGTRHICTSVFLERILTKSVPGRYWHLYKVRANSFDEDAAEFFLDFHCRLTEQPVSIQPIWPTYIKGPYVIRHDRREMVFYVRGNVTTKSFPLAALSSYYSTENGKIEYITCNDRQQLISAGRSKMLKYTYLWREPLDCQTKIPTIIVTDIAGNVIQPGSSDKLPIKGVLCICAPYDGLAIIKKRGKTLEKRRLTANMISEISALQFDSEIEIFQGLDSVWSIKYQRSELFKQGDTQLLRRLQNCTGQLIPIPHSLGAAAERLNSYPQVKQWLYSKIREGHMPISAYREFRHFIEHLAAK